MYESENCTAEDFLLACLRTIFIESAKKLTLRDAITEQELEADKKRYSIQKISNRWKYSSEWAD